MLAVGLGEFDALIHAQGGCDSSGLTESRPNGFHAYRAHGHMRAGDADGEQDTLMAFGDHDTVGDLVRACHIKQMQGAFSRPFTAWGLRRTCWALNVVGIDAVYSNGY